MSLSFNILLKERNFRFDFSCGKQQTLLSTYQQGLHKYASLQSGSFGCDRLVAPRGHVVSDVLHVLLRSLPWTSYVYVHLGRVVRHATQHQRSSYCQRGLLRLMPQRPFRTVPRRCRLSLRRRRLRWKQQQQRWSAAPTATTATTGPAELRRSGWRCV